MPHPKIETETMTRIIRNVLLLILVASVLEASGKQPFADLRWPQLGSKSRVASVSTSRLRRLAEKETQRIGRSWGHRAQFGQRVSYVVLPQMLTRTVNGQRVLKDGVEWASYSNLRVDGHNPDGTEVFYLSNERVYWLYGREWGGQPGRFDGPFQGDPRLELRRAYKPMKSPVGFGN